MKKLVKKTAELAKFTLVPALTTSGKNCFAIISALRLSVDSFKEFMQNVRTSGGFAFIKFDPAQNARIIHVMKLDERTISTLLNSCKWITAEQVKAERASLKKTKPSAKKTAKAQAVADMQAEGVPSIADLRAQLAAITAMIGKLA